MFTASAQACSKKCAKKSPGDLHTFWKHVCVDVYVTDSFEHARSRACMHTVSRVLRGVDGARRRKCCRKKKVVDDVFISNNGQLRVKSNLLCRRSFEASIPRMLRAAVRKIQAAQPGQARLHERGVPLIPTREEW